MQTVPRDPLAVAIGIKETREKNSCMTTCLFIGSAVLLSARFNCAFSHETPLRLLRFCDRSAALVGHCFELPAGTRIGRRRGFECPVHLRLLHQLHKRFGRKTHFLQIEPAILHRAARRIAAQFTQGGYDAVFSPGTVRAVFLPASIPVLAYLDASKVSWIRTYFGLNTLCERSRRHVGAVDRSSLGHNSMTFFASHWAVAEAARDYGIPMDRMAVVPFGANLVDPPTRAEVEAWIETGQLASGRSIARTRGEVDGPHPSRLRTHGAASAWAYQGACINSRLLWMAVGSSSRAGMRTSDSWPCRSGWHAGEVIEEALTEPGIIDRAGHHRPRRAGLDAPASISPWCANSDARSTRCRLLPTEPCRAIFTARRLVNLHRLVGHQPLEAASSLLPTLSLSWLR